MRGGWAAAVAMVLTLSGCAADSAPRQDPSRVLLPPVTGQFDYQLGGADDETDLAVVVRDASSRPVPGAYNVCYVNGFQTQPEQSATWAADHAELLLHDGAGRLAVDPDWPDEYVLDPSSASQRAAILDIIGPTIADCAAAGFDGVEIDNLDTWTRFADAETGVISKADAVQLARDYADLAHRHGLAIAQKNTLELAATGPEIGFDFAVVEECGAYDECAGFRDAYDAHVLQIEYADNLPRSFADLCRSRERAPLTILRDRDLVPAGQPGHVREQCPDQ
ncbi:endo-alpha-1,4-polygalactosaminidase (GH114 family) [Nocardioides daedukensis]|uniref:Endo-alpha-1,4-polygalactosaminidase (GH114 family) n=1 Tax=Nocardioides daedukensis TaxID=634462 RepID=A0A7Y9UN94_9ACTN|nr:endo alpha-1,4 polygalactosaminidase [Nocardioides daedukensis]NYG58318.1 endo-alpha-1,4-polygalactosaminidase (GH114 family) [Nocardioides daedukensis]